MNGAPYPFLDSVSASVVYRRMNRLGLIEGGWVRGTGYVFGVTVIGVIINPSVRQ